MTDTPQSSHRTVANHGDGERPESLRLLRSRRRFGRVEWLALGIALALHAVAFALVPGPLNNALRQAPEILLSLNLEQPMASPIEEAVDSHLDPPARLEAEQRSARNDVQAARDGPSAARPLRAPVGDMQPDESALKPVAASESEPEPREQEPGPAEIWAELSGALELRDAADTPVEAELPVDDSGSVEAAPPAERPAESPEPALEADVDAEAFLRQYAATIRALIEAEKYYPVAAERLGHHGTVKVGFTLSAAGEVSAIYVKQGSGHRSLDDAAVEAVRRSARFPVIPPEIGRDSLALSVSLKYSLR